MSAHAYIYKGFTIAYSVNSKKDTNELFGSYGYIFHPKDKSHVVATFHTDYSTKEGVESQIKKLMEEFIDFEWKQYHPEKERIF